MKFSYTPGEEIIQLLTAIAEKKGEIKVYFLDHQESIDQGSPQPDQRNKEHHADLRKSDDVQSILAGLLQTGIPASAGRTGESNRVSERTSLI
jgi:hypothetical protein